MLWISEDNLIMDYYAGRKEYYKQSAEAWLSALTEEIPYKNDDNQVIIPVLDFYGTLFLMMLVDRNPYLMMDREGRNILYSEEYMKKKFTVYRFASFLDNVDPRLQGRFKSREEIVAELVARNLDVLEYAQEGLNRGQKAAIERGLSGSILDENFREQINLLWETCHPFLVNEDVNN